MKALVRAIAIGGVMLVNFVDIGKNLFTISLANTRRLNNLGREVIDRLIQDKMAVALLISGTVAIAIVVSQYENVRIFLELQAPYDVFGIKRIYPSDMSGQFWDSRSWLQSSRTLTSPQTDPQDPYFQVRGSSNTLTIKGDGTAESSGPMVRYYISNPQGQRNWKNFEFTMYSMRVSEISPPSYAGFAVQGRTGPGHTDKPATNGDGYPIQCDGSSYAAAIRYNGLVDFKKELKWPNYTKQNPISTLYPDGVPNNRWIGMKYVVYNINQDVKMEVWIDETEGKDGGDWQKVLEHIDDGGWTIPAAEAAYSCGYSVDEKLLDGGPAIIVRNDGVGKQLYKNLSIREIQVKS